jgi:hypothetical protein
MDPVTIATAVVAFLSPYFTEGGKAAAKKVGEALVATIKRRFQGKPAAEEALKDVEETPQDEDLQAALRVQLKKVMQQDEVFAAELATLLDEARRSAPATYQARLIGSGAIAQGEGATAVGERGVAIGGSVGGDVSTGDK